MGVNKKKKKLDKVTMIVNSSFSTLQVTGN